MFLSLRFQALGGGFPRELFIIGFRQMAAGVRGPSAREHHVRAGQPRVCLPHHSLQLPGREDTGRPARTTR